MNFSTKSLVSAIMVIISLVFGYFVVLPRWDGFKAAKAQLADAQAKQTQLTDAQNQLNAFIAQYKQHETDAATIDSALPLDQPKVYDILKNMEQMSAASGLSLGNLQILDTSASDTLGAQPNTIQPLDVSFTVSGSSAGFIDFLKKLESSLRIIDVQSITMKADDTGNTIKDDVKFRTYYQN